MEAIAKGGPSRRTLLASALTLSGVGLLGVPAMARNRAPDFVLHGARVIDPESGLDAIRDVRISHGRIVEIAARSIDSRRIIDARGLVVGPGFVDLHAHDITPFTQGLHAQDGVTSTFELETGVYPAATFYRHRSGNSPINYGANASHTQARAIVFGAIHASALKGVAELEPSEYRNDTWRTAKASPAQRAAIMSHLARELDAGALGIGYHIATTPGTDTEELTEAFALAARRRALNMIHIRSVGQVSPSEAAREVVEIARKTGASVHVAHANSSGLWETRALIDVIDQARASGVDITTEAYPYTGAQSSLSDPRTEPEGMAAFHASYADLELLATGERLTAESFAHYKRLYPNGELVAHVMKQEDVDYAIVHPGVMVGSDGGAFHEGKGQPRGAGAFSRIFHRYVREQKSLTLIEALAKVSYLPARRLEPFAPGMRERGRVQEGAVADLTVFDPDKIADRATYKDGAQPSTGIAYVFVGGRPVVDRYRLQRHVAPGVPIWGNGRDRRS